MLLRKGQKVVFLHGFLGSKLDWDPYLSDFPHTLALNLPGHGGEAFYPLEQLFDQIPKGSHIVGYSLGGRIAMHLIAQRPDFFSSSIIISAHPGLETHAEKMLRITKETKWINLLETEDLPTFLEAWYGQDLFKNTRIPPHRYEQNREHLLQAFKSYRLSEWPSFWHLLENPPIPLTFLFGENDLDYKLIYERLKSNEKVSSTLIKNSSHAIVTQKVDLCRDLIKETLCKLQPL